MTERSETDRSLRVPLGDVARAAIVVIALWALGNLIWLGRDLLFVAFFAVLFSLFLSIFVDRLEGAGVPRGLGTLICLLGLVGVGVGFWFAIWPALADQFGTVRERLPEVVQQIDEWLQRATGLFLAEGGDAQLLADLRARLSSQAGDLLSGALPLLNTVFGVAFGLFIVVFAGAYLAVNPKLYLEGGERLLPPRLRGRVEPALRSSGRNLKQWMIGQAFAMLLIGVLSSVGLWLLDVPAPLALGVIAGLLQFIPTYGPLMSSVPAAAMALIVSPTTALWVLGLYAGIQFVETNLITPLVMRETAELPPALTILFQALMGILFGFLGLLLAVPILAGGMVLVRELYVEPLENGAAAPQPTMAR